MKIVESIQMPKLAPQHSSKQVFMNILDKVYVRHYLDRRAKAVRGWANLRQQFLKSNKEQ